MKKMRTFFLCRQTVFLLTLTLSVLFCAYVFDVVRGYPVITLDFDAHQLGKNVILEAEYADGTNMSFLEAEKILRDGRKCEIILSDDDGSSCSGDSFGGHKKWGFF